MTTASPFVLRTNLANDLRRQFAKASKPRVDLDENADAWKQKAEDALIQQHPWVSKVRIHTVIGLKSTEGYGVGFFHLTPRQVPAAATGEDQINVLSVPIIISDFKLAPLDIFHYNGQFYPLNEERALRLLRLPDIFVETDRSPREFERRHYDSRRAFGGNLGLERWGSFDGKTSTPRLDALKRELKAAVAECLRAPVGGTRQKLSSLCGEVVSRDQARIERVQRQVPALTMFLQDKTSSIRFQDPGEDASRIKISEAQSRAFVELAELSGIEMKVEDDAIYTRDWWHSSPDTGCAKVSSWEPASFHEVSRALGEQRAAQLIEKRWMWQPIKESEARGRVTRTMQEGRSDQISRDLEEMADPAWFDASRAFSKSSESMMGEIKSPKSLKLAGAPAVKLMVVNPKKRLGLPETFETYIVNSPICNGLGNTRIGLLLPSGTLILPADEWNCFDDMHAVPTRGEPLTSLPEIKGVRRYVRLDHVRDKDFDLVKVIMWMTDGVIQGILVREDQMEIDGQRYYEAFDAHQWSSDRDEDVPVVVRLSKDFARVMREERNEATVFHAPAGARVITLGERSEPGDDSLKTSSSRVFEHGSVSVPALVIKTSAPAQVYLGWTPPGDDASQVDVRFERGKYRIKCSSMDTLFPFREWCGPRDAAGALHYLGMNTAQVKQVMSQARTSGWLSVEMDLPELGAGKRVADQALERSFEKDAEIDRFVSKVSSAELIKAAALSWSQARSLPPGKTSSVTMGMTVDAALSLGFLNRQNLMKFVDARPELEDCLSRLCSILMGCRIGMTEVPEDAVELAIDGLEPVLQGLRVLEMSLNAF